MPASKMPAPSSSSRAATVWLKSETATNSAATNARSVCGLMPARMIAGLGQARREAYPGRGDVGDRNVRDLARLRRDHLVGNLPRVPVALFVLDVLEQRDHRQAEARRDVQRA